MKKLIFALAAFSAQAALAQNIEVHEGSQSYLDFGQKEWKVKVGGGIAAIPLYEGASKDRIHPLPLFDAESGRYFISTARGIGMNFSDNPDIQFGPRFTLSRGRKQSLDPRLAGTGDINTTGDLGAFFNARFSPWFVTTALRAGEHGSLVELGGGYDIRFTPADRVRIDANAMLANNKYMQTYFGVNSVQSALSGLPVYGASSGIKDAALHVNWMHSFSREWFGNVGFTAKQLSGSAKNSPLVTSRSQNSANLLLGYSF